MIDINLKIEGMSCQHCVSNVKKSIENIDGIMAYAVNVGSANITYDESINDRDTIVNAVSSAGYKVTSYGGFSEPLHKREVT